MSEATYIIWRSSTPPGHEWCRLDEEMHSLRGSVVLEANEGPCSLTYAIRCDAGWRTLGASVEGWVGERRIEIAIEALGGRWSLNGTHVPAVEGCFDVDLNFSPSTNALPIRRLRLEVGASASVRAAWLRFPSFQLELLEQSYTRTAHDAYRYESASGFSRALFVHGSGLVLDYPEFWSAQSVL